ncbi:mechanosensitive ion channel family protein [Natronosalvus caseinilyticus]|uniref:mechanosensitive ion channel family protein n=1 Tax=Natronosalvus caseinilyticus TaxID=2953747 RepID=UPI0028B18053|nr:mechanosensitive ion channel family protein [Natronosalvus caseinilyticus]
MLQNATGGNETALEEGLRSLAPDWVPPGVVDVAFAAFVLIVGWYLSKVVVRLTGRTIAQKIERPSVTRTVLRAVRITVIAFTVLIAANILGLTGVEILLPVTVISAMVGIVLAPLVGSLINGLFVLSDQPYEIGDMIEVTDSGHRGFVEDITIRYTKIFTLENTFIVIPNSEINARDVVNFSAEDERTRLSVSFEITYESDLETAIRVSERATRGVDNVIAGGPDIRIGSARYAASPTCDVLEYGDSGVTLQVRYWVNHPYKITVVRSAVHRAIRDRFSEEGVEFAYPHTHHVFDETSGTARVAQVDRELEPRPTSRKHEQVADGDGDGSGNE